MTPVFGKIPSPTHRQDFNLTSLDFFNMCYSSLLDILLLLEMLIDLARLMSLRCTELFYATGSTE